MLILQQAIQDDELRQRLVTTFNDKDEASIGKLEAEINALEGIEKLRYKPHLLVNEVGEDLVQLFESYQKVPTLFFIDPWGYKGLSLRLINSVLRDWGCECIFFFNYNRINMGVTNEVVKEHIDALFGEDRGGDLRERIMGRSPDDREVMVLEEICEALIEMGGKYTLPFGFKNEHGSRTKHHLIFVSKNSLGYKIMKGVMAAQSSGSNQGVPTFEYNPATVAQPLLFELQRPLDDLEGMLLEQYAGQTLSMDAIYEEHNYGRPYIEKNYKAVLTKLEMQGAIIGSPPHDKRRKRHGLPTCAGETLFTFPAR